MNGNHDNGATPHWRFDACRYPVHIPCVVFLIHMASRSSTAFDCGSAMSMQDKDLCKRHYCA